MCAGLAGQVRAGRVDALAARLPARSSPDAGRASRSPDRGAACAARRRSPRRAGRGRGRSARRCTARACGRARPRAQRRGAGAGAAKSRSSRFTLTGSRTCGRVARSLRAGRAGRRIASASAVPRRWPDDRVGRPLDRPASGSGPGAQSSAASRARRAWPPSSVADERLRASVSRPQPTQSSVGLVECGSVNIWEKKNSRKPGSRAASSGGSTSPSPVSVARAPRRTGRRAFLLGGIVRSGRSGAMKHEACDPLRDARPAGAASPLAPSTATRPPRARSPAASITASASRGELALGRRRARRRDGRSGRCRARRT